MIVRNHLKASLRASTLAVVSIVMIFVIAETLIEKLDNVYVNGVAYANEMGTAPSEDFIEIEPVFGVMTRMRRSYAMVFSPSCFENSKLQDCGQFSHLPFPSLQYFKD